MWVFLNALPNKHDPETQQPLPSVFKRSLIVTAKHTLTIGYKTQRQKKRKNNVYFSVFFQIISRLMAKQTPKKLTFKMTVSRRKDLQTPWMLKTGKTTFCNTERAMVRYVTWLHKQMLIYVKMQECGAMEENLCIYSVDGLQLCRNRCILMLEWNNYICKDGLNRVASSKINSHCGPNGPD